MTDLKPMKMTDIPFTDAEKYLDDPNWVLEQKMDGARALITMTLGELQDDGTYGVDVGWQASGGGPLKFAAAVQHFAALEETLVELFNHNGLEKLVLDGELIVEDGVLHVFDLPELTRPLDGGPAVGPFDSYKARRSVLDDLFAYDDFENVKVVYSADTEDEKRALWLKINIEGVEGGMLKDVRAPYEAGIRTKNQLKLKLVKTADVVVMKVDRKLFDHKGMVTHGSADLAVYIEPSEDPKPWVSQITGKRISHNERERMFAGSKTMQAKALAYESTPAKLLPIGAASLIGKDLTIEYMSVVEIRFLYWTGDAVVQPAILRKRSEDEKRPWDCTLDQFPQYSRKAVS